MTVLIDTGPIVAMYDRNDPHHRQCVEAAHHLPDRCLTCWPVLTEAAYLLRRYPIPLQQLFKDLAGGSFSVAAIDQSSFTWIADFMARYASLPAQLADAALMYLAEREGIETIFTLDRRDFSVYRLSGGRSVDIIPA